MIISLSNSLLNEKSEPVIRRANASDYTRISELHNFWALQNLSGNLQNGFLLLETSPEKIKSLSTGDNILLVACVGDAVVGYVLAVQKPEMLDQLNWIENLNDIICNQKHYHVSEMAVASDCIGHGVGKALYSELFKLTKSVHLSAYVATQPYNNQASIKFHERLGFRKIATFSANEFCGLNHYSSNLYFFNNT